MAPKQTSVEPSDEPWLAFRRKHDAELNELQLQAKKSYEQFQQNVNKAKAALLAKHKKEEEEFWSKAKAASKDKNKNGNKSAVSKAGVQGQANRRVAAPPLKATPGVKQTPAASSEAPETPKSTYNTTTLARQTRSKSAAVTIIDLCSDDDEPVPEQKKPAPPPIAKDPMLGSQSSNNIEPAGRREYSIPSATLELFGKGANPGTPEPSQFKREHSVFTQQSPQPFTPSPITSHRASIAALPTQQSSISKGDGFGGWASANTFRMPAAQMQGSRQGSAWASGTISSSAASTWATPTISASQGVQPSSDFAPSRFSQYRQPPRFQQQQNIGYQLGQSSMAQESAVHGLPLDDGGTSKGSVAIPHDEHKNKPDAEDMLMPKAPQTPPKPQQYIPNMLPSPSPSPRTPTVQPLTPTTPATPSFRRPCLPASAMKDSIPAARNVRAVSQASNSTYRASSITQSQRDSSVTSRTSVSSHSSVARGKRKVVDISSDEESDYSPPSDDDEPISPITRDDVSKHVKSNTKQAPRPVTKKAKLPSPLPSAITSKGVFSKGKNGFGFQTTSKPKAKVNNHASFSLPNPPPRVSIKKPQPSTPTTPTPTSRKPTATASTTATRAAPVPRSTRKAKLDASAKISQLSETELQTRNNIAIDEANEYEAPETGIVEQVRGSLRSMSITPAPSTAGDNAAEDVEMLADVSDSESTIAVQSTKHGAGWNSWTRSRANGDRYLAKSRSNRPLVQDDDEDDDYEDPDISKYSVVNGIILHEADLENVRLTKEQDRRSLMRSRGIDGGSHARAVSVVEMLKHRELGRSERITMRAYGRNGTRAIGRN